MCFIMMIYLSLTKLSYFWIFLDDDRVEIIDHYQVHTAVGDTLYIQVDVSQAGLERVCTLTIRLIRQGKRLTVYSSDRQISDHENVKTLYPRITSFTCIYDTPTLRCYEFWSKEIIFISKNTETMFTRNIDDLTDCESSFDNIIMPLASEKFYTGEWLWVKVFSEILLRKNIPNVRKTLKRYAQGHFTLQELSTNKTSKITPSEVQIFSKHLLNCYGSQ